MTRDDTVRNFKYEIASAILKGMAITNTTFHAIDKRLGWNLGATKVKLTYLISPECVGDNTRKDEKSKHEYMRLDDVAVIFWAMGLDIQLRVVPIENCSEEEHGSGI